MRGSSALVLGLVVALAFLGDGPSPARDNRVEALASRYRQWLEEVEPLASKEEVAAFLALEMDHQRDAFIEAFWKARDPNPRTEVNEYKDGYYARRDEVLTRFGSRTVDQARIYITNGAPSSVIDYPDGCTLLLWPIQIWRYQSSLVINRSFTLLFYAPQHRTFKLWHPEEGFAPLIALPVCSNPADACNWNSGAFIQMLWRECRVAREVDDIGRAVLHVEGAGPAGVLAAEGRPRPADEEWLSAFRSFSTGAPAASEPLEALSFSFPGRQQSRTVVRGEITLPTATLSSIEIGSRAAYELELTGEVLREERLFETFRYRFDVPTPDPSQESVSLVFDRLLRPGRYSLIARLEDLGSERVFRSEVPLVVPRVEDDEGPSEVSGEEAPTEQSEATRRPEGPRVRLVLPGDSFLVGPRRFDAEVSGEGVRRVQFLLDERPLLTKTRPPFSVEINLGTVPRRHTLEVVAFDSAGRELASDGAVINAGEQAFAVRLVEPRRGHSYGVEVQARAEVLVPAGSTVASVEFFLGERRVATLYQEPFTQRISLPSGEELAFVRVVASLQDGREAEDLVVVRGSPFGEEIEVTTVELFATVVDGSGRPVSDLPAEAFEVREDGRLQTLLRFAEVRDLPYHVALLIDTSASMAENLDAIRRAAFGFLERDLDPRDRAAIFTFSNGPRLETPFTADLAELAGGLASIKAEQSTALFDSVVFATYYLQGIQGQRALIVLSDGRDQRSERSVEEAAEFAQRTGVTVYTLGLSLGRFDINARSRLQRLAEATGGRCFLLGSAPELAAAYALIAEELRRRYLLVYQSSSSGRSDEFRPIEVRVARPGLEVRTLRGYFP